MSNMFRSVAFDNRDVYSNKNLHCGNFSRTCGFRKGPQSLTLKTNILVSKRTKNMKFVQKIFVQKLIILVLRRIR